MLQKLVTRQLFSLFSPLLLVQCLAFSQYSVRMKSNGHSIFSCSLNRFTEKDTMIKYAWMIQNVPQNVLDKLTTYANFPSLTASVTLEDLPHNLLFRKMSCNISWKKNETNSNWTEPISSNTLTATIQCPEENAVVKRSGYATDIIIKENTKYIAENSLCKRELRQRCSVDIAVLFEEKEAKHRRCSAEESVPIIMKKGNCTERHPLNALTKGINISIMSTLSLDKSLTLDTEDNVKMSVTVYNSQDHTFLQKCTINITMQNETYYSRVCEAYNDPHITTFDAYQFNFMNHGLFLLYKRNYEMFEVYIKLYDCLDGHKKKMIGATCIGEVVVVSEDDFILFRIHDEEIQIFSPDSQISSKLEKHTDHWSFIVTFPTGTRVLVLRENFLRQSVQIYSSRYDKSNTTGLCGDSNDILSDDSRHSFADESSLRWRSGGDRYLITENVHKRSLHCSCLKGKRQFCGFGLQAYLCITTKVRDFTAIYMRRAMKPPLKWPKF